MRWPEWIRAAFVIARRDYQATVFSKTFLFFLLGPLFPLALGALFGGVGNQIARGDEQSPRIAVVSSVEDYGKLVEAQARIAPVIPRIARVEMVHVAPSDDLVRQRQEILAGGQGDVIGVLEDPLGEEPHFIGGTGGDNSSVKQLALFIEEARQAEAAPPGRTQLKLTQQERVAASIETVRKLLARAGQMLLFVLTLLLSTMLLSQMLEEKGNKVIEVLAAAVPIDSIFVGKLFAMLAISLTGIFVWFLAGAAMLAFFYEPGAGVNVLGAGPAIGWPVYLLLIPVYFAMSYLLIGAAFLGIGAQASTAREVQILSMPVTMFQVVLLLIAFAGVGRPDSWQAIGAAVFPLSSPFAMLGRAAEDAALWPHLLALAWQALWVALILKFASRMFKRSVLKSGPRGEWRKWFGRPARQ
ncbi:ABC transporter permease [Sphingomicrobium lutaoense]|uniref:ABC-2 type transport system permease protein n=1 Tax=Sphingomicrobium lutaoense TaxID=515949 RepID=A0A839Z4J6_9SPHN|nr:ABC transporter permease [Sphingomicrobium lutaoense]MBB3765027.1 ABC-2 type transport system permease protein [Sphingomicrobium lutaoense]